MAGEGPENSRRERNADLRVNLRGADLSSSLKMLYIIGLGLADERDVSVKGLDIIRRAERVYLEAYTAVLLVDQQQLVSANPSSSD